MAPRLDSEADWQLECGEIKQRGAHLLRTGQWSDCMFHVGTGEDQVNFKAHKLILAMASPVFEAMFYGPIAEGNGPISIPDMTPEAFGKLLDYLYTDNIELESVVNARDLYYGGQKYMLPHLMKVCTTYLACNLNPQTAGHIYEFAQLIGDEYLVEESLQLFRMEPKAVLEDTSFSELDKDTLLKVFTMDPLNIDSELDLFAAAERYAKALDSPATDEGDEACAAGDFQDIKVAEMDVENNSEDHQDSGSEEIIQTLAENGFGKNDGRRASIRELLQQIRFLTLTVKQLAEYKTLSSLLTESDILALFMNIASKDTHMPMPSGFSTCREQRDRS